MQNHNSQEVSSRIGNQSDYSDFVKGTNVLPYLVAILTDCYNMNPLYGRTDYLRDCETMSRRYMHEGLSFATKTLPELFDGLLNYLENGSSVYPSFRILKGQNYPVFLQQLFGQIYADHNSECAVKCVECLYQLCAAFKKLKGPYKKSVLVKQLNEFIEIDQSLKGDNEWSMFSSNELLVLEKARNIVRQVLQGLDPTDPNQAHLFVPRPGPGATNTPTEAHERYRPHMKDAQLRDYKFEEWYYPPSYPPRGKRPWDLRVGKSASRCELKTRALLTSRLKFVHKTFGKARGICIEELEMQWLQQAFRRALYDRIEAHPLTSGYVSFRDQTINGLLALQSSRTREMSTIDMSSASDRVSRALVEYLFQDNKPLLKGLLDLSTRIIQLPNELTDRKFLHVRKYAPMGSALCFPVMGLIHFALIKAILSNNSPQHINDIPVYVYGDDILVDTLYTDIVIKELPRFGMKLNAGKSFYKSHFRESCGVHAYNGMDVTPVRFKSIVQSHSSVNDLVGLLKQESALEKRGYMTTAMLIRNEFLKVPTLRSHNFPFVGPKSSILGWIRELPDAPADLQKISKYRRWNQDYQSFQYKVRTIVDLLDDAPPLLDDVEAYLRMLVVRPELDSRKMSGLSTGLSIRWQWHADSGLGFHREFKVNLQSSS